MGFLSCGPCGGSRRFAGRRLSSVLALGLRGHGAGVDELWRRDSFRRTCAGTSASTSASANSDASANSNANASADPSSDATAITSCMLLERLGRLRRLWWLPKRRERSKVQHGLEQDLRQRWELQVPCSRLSLVREVLTRSDDLSRFTPDSLVWCEAFRTGNPKLCRRKSQFQECFFHL